MTRFYPYDLFGEIPVTIPDLYRWTRENAPHVTPGWRTDHYIKDYNVHIKVARAKLDGSF